MKNIKISFDSPVILTFTIISFIAFILDKITGGWSNTLFFSVYRSSLSDPLTYLRLVGHIFGHGSWAHFIGNTSLILVLGTLLEERYTSLRLAFIIFIAAIVTGIAHIIMMPNVYLLGASGIVFALIMLSPFASMKDDKIPMTFILVAIIYLGGELYQGIFVRDNISQWTHILGGVVGFLSGFYLRKK